jgi:hypothetical protein
VARGRTQALRRIIMTMRMMARTKTIVPNPMYIVAPDVWPGCGGNSPTSHGVTRFPTPPTGTGHSAAGSGDHERAGDSGSPKQHLAFGDELCMCCRARLCRVPPHSTLSPQSPFVYRDPRGTGLSSGARLRGSRQYGQHKQRPLRSPAQAWGSQEGREAHRPSRRQQPSSRSEGTGSSSTGSRRSLRGRRRHPQTCSAHRCEPQSGVSQGSSDSSARVREEIGELKTRRTNARQGVSHPLTSAEHRRQEVIRSRRQGNALLIRPTITWCAPRLSTPASTASSRTPNSPRRRGPPAARRTCGTT